MRIRGFDPVVLALVPQVIGRDEVRRAVDQGGRPGLPPLSQTAEVLEAYLLREKEAGRLRPAADVATAALSVVATGHLLLAGELGARPTREAIREVVENLLVGLERGA